MAQVELYNDQLDFPENKEQGPFGGYANVDQPYQNEGQPQYDFFGNPVYSPFGIGAGPLPTSRHVGSALRLGYDIVTFKSVRTDTHPLNEYPQVRPVTVEGDLDPNSPGVPVAEEYAEERIAVANSFGIPSVKPEEWQPDMREALEMPMEGQIVLAAFQGTARGKGREAYIQDHIEGVGLVLETGAKVVEINLSCPNEGEAVLTCFDTAMTVDIVKAVREKYPDLKFIIKLAYFSDQEQLTDLVKKTAEYVDGYSVINTIPVPVLDANGETVFPGREKAGVSGAPIKWAGLEMVSKLDEIRKEGDYDYKIVGLGGVTNAQDFHDYRAAGADIVMSVAGAMWNPGLAAEIKESLKQAA